MIETRADNELMFIVGLYAIAALIWAFSTFLMFIAVVLTILAHLS